MGISRGKKIITDGLVIHLDPANTKSYPGSGTTAYDLTNLNLSLSLVNGVAFNNNYFEFDGTNDGIYSATNNIAGYGYSDDITWSCWLNPTAFVDTTKHVYYGRAGGGQQGFGTGFEYSSSIYKFWFEVYGFTGGRQKIYISDITPNEWAYYSVTVNHSALTYTLYKNGIQYSTAGLSEWTQYTGTTFYYVGSYANAIYFYSGKLSSMKVYNRVLSPTEILQNYNATKGRFI
jgi:hypothetical protein